MKKVKHFLKRYWFENLVLMILLLTVILRFVNFENRWGLGYDQAHDAVVARYALTAHKLPLLGPFSSAGPFQTAGEWYWFIMAATAIYPNSVLTPWVILALLSVVFVLLMMVMGKEMINKQFGIILGLLSAVSTAQITQSTNLTNQVPLALISLLVIWSMVRFVRERKVIYLFLLGFFISLTASIHLQGVALITLAFFVVLLVGKATLKWLPFLLAGLLLPWLPVLLVDFNRDFFNTRNMLYYFFHDQYLIPLEVLGRRWLTYAGVLWPNLWSFVIGGYQFSGYIVIPLVVLLTFASFLKKNIAKEWAVMTLSFLTMVIIIRYTRTPLFQSYFVFLHPFIIILTGWVIFNLKEKSVFIGLLLLSGIIVGSLSQDIKEIKETTNSTALKAKYWRDLLVGQYPNKKFAVYDYEYKSAGYSLPMVLFLEAKGLLNDNGYRIGFGTLEAATSSAHTEVKGNQMGLTLWDLNSSSSAELLKAGWSFINPSKIYYATEEWYSRANK